MSNRFKGCIQRPASSFLVGAEVQRASLPAVTSLRVLHLSIAVPQTRLARRPPPTPRQQIFSLLSTRFRHDLTVAIISFLLNFFHLVPPEGDTNLIGRLGEGCHQVVRFFVTSPGMQLATQGVTKRPVQWPLPMLLSIFVVSTLCCTLLVLMPHEMRWLLTCAEPRKWAWRNILALRGGL